MVKTNNVLETIHNTPVVKVNRLFGPDKKVFVKIERNNPGGSIKDRIALAMIEDAEKKGLLKPGASEIIEPTSGNTGIGLALVGAVKGYPVTLVMPDSLSIERRRLMVAYGAKLVLTPKEKGMTGSIAKAKELVAERPGAWMPMQFENPANVDIHESRTARELLADFPDGIDYLITGVGTGGHISGCARLLKSKFPKLKVFAVEPAAAPVLSGGKGGPHPLQGIGAGFIPRNCYTDLLDGIIQITKEEAFDYAAKSAKLEGLFVGISSGASLAAVAKKLPEIPAGSTVVTFTYDTGERYLSVADLFVPGANDIIDVGAPVPPLAEVATPAAPPIKSNYAAAFGKAGPKDNVLQLIGNTPEVKINRLYDPNQASVYVKVERFNPGGSIKDRIALSMVEDAEAKGLLQPGWEIIEPTSGNTGIGLALVAAVKGYPLTLVMPESMSVERRRLMVAYGARIVLTERAKGMGGAIAKAKELIAQRPKSWMPQQFENTANVTAHEEYTAQEILRDFPDGLDYLITGVGTGGHISGCAKVLKKAWPHLKVFAVEPTSSPVLSGGKPGPHPIQGIGAGFVPTNCYTDLLDGIIQVSNPEAFDYAARSAREEGLFVGISSGASLAAVAKKLPEVPRGSRVLAFSYDTGERYLSVEGLFPVTEADIIHSAPTDTTPAATSAPVANGSPATQPKAKPTLTNLCLKFLLCVDKK